MEHTSSSSRFTIILTILYIHIIIIILCHTFVSYLCVISHIWIRISAPSLLNNAPSLCVLQFILPSGSSLHNTYVVRVISIDNQCKDGNARFKNRTLETLFRSKMSFIWLGKFRVCIKCLLFERKFYVFLKRKWYWRF